MPWLAPRLTDGLCNRLFQIVGADYHSRINKRPLVFYVPRISPSAHSDCSLVLKLFPSVPVIWESPIIHTAVEGEKDFLSFKPLIIPDENTVVSGYFQNWGYFPKEQFKLDFKNTLSKESFETNTLTQDMNPDKLWWIHVRLGDYSILPHHQCTDTEYWVNSLDKIPDGSVVLLFSDEVEKARIIIENAAGFISRQIKILACNPNLTAVETLYIMSQCGGGCIGSNSSFSYWGMYLSRAKELGNPCILPSKWHRDYNGTMSAPWLTNF